jgi:hypothetical protein
MISPKYFTFEEANALLPTIEPLMGDLLEKRARAARMAREIQPLLADVRVDVGGVIPSELAVAFADIEALIAQIQSFGCMVKDLNGGLLDFLSERNGRDVYLCWRYGESTISHYHELHTGFNGRRPV